MHKRYIFNEDREGFGDNLKKLMAVKGYTLQDLSEKISYDESTIKKWRSGSRIPSLETLKELAQIFDISIHELYLPNSIYAERMSDELIQVSSGRRLDITASKKLFLEVNEYFNYLFQKTLLSFLSPQEKKHMKNLFEYFEIAPEGIRSLELENDNKDFETFYYNARAYVCKRYGKCFPYKVTKEISEELFNEAVKWVVEKDLNRVETLNEGPLNYGKTLDKKYRTMQSDACSTCEYIFSLLSLKHEGWYLLRDLFDISDSALTSWIKGYRQISQDKLVVLASLFGVTIDEFIERKINTEYFFEAEYGFDNLEGIIKFKNFSYSTLKDLFNNLLNTCESIKYHCLGRSYYGGKQHDIFGKDSYLSFIYLWQIDYSCNKLDIDVAYDLRDGKKYYVSKIRFGELEYISKLLYDDWGKEAPNHIETKYGSKYDEIFLLSKNTDFLYQIIEEKKVDSNYYLTLWNTLKKKEDDYDKENIIGKLLISGGGELIINGFPNKEKTIELMCDMIKNDVEIRCNKSKGWWEYGE